MDIKLKTDNKQKKHEKHKYRERGTWPGMLLVILCAAIAGMTMLFLYPRFNKNAAKTLKEAKMEDDGEPVKQKEISWDSSMRQDVLFAIYYMNYELGDQQNPLNYFTQNYDTGKLTKEENKALESSSDALIQFLRDRYYDLTSDKDTENTFYDAGNGYSSETASYAYDVSQYRYSCYAVAADDANTPVREYGADKNLYQTAVIDQVNIEADEYPDYKAGLILHYDKDGIPSLSGSWAFKGDLSAIVNDLRSADISDLDLDSAWLNLSEYQDEIEDQDELAVFTTNAMRLKQIPLPVIRNTTFVFGIRERQYDADEYEGYTEQYAVERDAYLMHGYLITAWMMGLSMVALAFILQNIPPLGLRKNRLFSLPAELYITLGCVGITTAGLMVYNVGFAKGTMGTELQEAFMRIGFSGASVRYITRGFIWSLWAVFAFFWYWLTASLLPYLTHPLKTLKDNLLILKNFQWLKSRIRDVFHWATEISLTEKDGKIIHRIVLINGIVVTLLCCIWYWGIILAVIYSLILYVYLKRKYYGIHEDYTRLLLRTKRIASGELPEAGADRVTSAETDRATSVGADRAISAGASEGLRISTPAQTSGEDVFYRINEELDRVQKGLSKAVSAEMRSRNMKTELITNVSHDLKTPLTAMIAYLELLKRKDITEEERNSYIQTLDQKTQRLRVLIEDLFEVSKAATGDIVMNFDDVDLVNLVKQVRLENEDKIAEGNLDIRWNLPEEKCVLLLDPNRTYRIIDNLLQNALKYSMPHTRVYIDMVKTEKSISIIIKNISAAEMNFKAEEITERFVRGDLARNTEGSGLGLAIARSFTELQGGRFDIEIDGDLFKASVIFT